MNKAIVLSLAVSVLGLALVASAYRKDIRAAERRLLGRSEVILTGSGKLEYATAGKGLPLLMIHGTGGGFDQGLSFTEGLVPHGVRVIAPSRFGYLGSDFPPQPSSERQADALAELLDHLSIRKAAVGGGSAGALSAVQFALRYPERTSALVLIVPAANVRDRDPVEMSAVQKWLVRRLTTSDFLFWAASKAARNQMIRTLLATDPILVERSGPSEQRRVKRILDDIMPVSRRWRGILNDAELAGRPARVDFSKITVPMLVVSADDDLFGTAATARDIAAAAPHAQLVIYPTGGHVLVGHEGRVWPTVAEFLRATAEARTMRRPDDLAKIGGLQVN